jgi:hypothetical protein
MIGIHVQREAVEVRVNDPVGRRWQRRPLPDLLDRLVLLVLSHRAQKRDHEADQGDRNEDNGRGEYNESRLHPYSMLLRIS